MLHINSVLAILAQLGIGPEGGYRITSDAQTWEDYLGERADIDDVRSYVYMKVRLMFDPPVSSAALSAMGRLCSEMEWRLQVSGDKPKKEGETMDGPL